jgi:hypothetical protein
LKRLFSSPPEKYTTNDRIIARVLSRCPPFWDENRWGGLQRSNFGKCFLRTVNAFITPMLLPSSTCTRFGLCSCVCAIFWLLSVLKLSLLL